jgi:hypothetical protein
MSQMCLDVSNVLKQEERKRMLRLRLRKDSSGPDIHRDMVVDSQFVGGRIKRGNSF